MKTYILAAIFMCSVSSWTKGEWENVVLRKVSIGYRSPSDAVTEFVKLVSESEAELGGFKGFVSCVVPERDSSNSNNVSVELKNVPILTALSYICESGKLKFRVVNNMVYIYRSSSESVVIETDKNVRNSLDLEKSGNVQITSLINALKLRGIELFEDECKMIINDTAIIVVQECDAEYLKAINEVAKRGLRIGVK
jgi:hypothetical protein